jgi:sec-independent protein translocase protein TatC
MTAVAPPPQSSEHDEFNPDEYRMTIGEHLEELRRRVILGLVGFALVFIVCLVFGDPVLRFFCRPLYQILEAKGLTPQLQYTELGEPFVVWIRVSLVVAAAISSPWVIYQLWQFVAAGLYPHERKYVTRYAPLSIALLICGMLFVYFLVLPWTIEFFIQFGNTIEMTDAHASTTQPYTPTTLPVLNGNPISPREGELWFDSSTGRMKTFIGGQTRSFRVATETLLTPDIKLSEYISLVIGMLVVFGISFQLPLVVLALARIGIVELDQLKRMRKYVYFALAILATAITPGDVLTASVALTVPLCLLYELGIWLARVGPKETST